MTMATTKRNTKKTVIILICCVLGMYAFGYALVPLYNVLCKSLGINGKTGGYAALSHGLVDKSRIITVQFMTVRNSSMPWEFRPKQRTVRLHPGENKRTAFYAHNTTNQNMTVQAIPSVSPGIAAKYLKKTECFCFTRQTMLAHQAMDWPILFHIDKHLPKNIHTITLAYTLFDLSKAPIRARGQPVGKIQ